MGNAASEAQRAQLVLNITAMLGRLEKSRAWLRYEERLGLAETLRDVADAIDQGAGERGQRRLRLVPRRLIRAGSDGNGRPLYKLLG